MLTAKLILERFSKDGGLLEKREQPSRSFLLNFIAFLYCAHVQITAAAAYTLQDITNTARTVDGQSWGHMSKSNLRIGAAPGLSGVYCTNGSEEGGVGDFSPDTCTINGELLGIVVGTGVGAVAPADYALGTKIAHGEAAGELQYGGCELLPIVIANPNGEFTIRRYLTNVSGGGITVEEVGIYSPGSDYLTFDAWPFCVARDLTGGVAVANTELLRVTYVVQITV